MNTLFVTFIIMGLSFVGLALGLILRNQPIKGSCGGMANLEEGSPCQICGRTDPSNCDK
ncbi:MAG: (Na+)-NQR maturation NqrM [Gammaproteobacteria bacterium]